MKGLLQSRLILSPIKNTITTINPRSILIGQQLFRNRNTITTLIGSSINSNTYSPRSLLSLGLNKNFKFRNYKCPTINIGYSNSKFLDLNNRGILYRNFSTVFKKEAEVKDDIITPKNTEISTDPKCINNTPIRTTVSSAKLSPSTTSSGYKDILRTFSIAKKELFPMFGAFILLLISSAIGMSLPLIIGKILDVSTLENKIIFGLQFNTFYTILGFAFVIGALANFGRIVLIRIIGERVVARMRSYCYRKTISQDAEFFDSNRVGDLISRLGNDVNIVSRSVTLNVSDGLKAIVSGVVGLSMMGYVSPQLTCVMLLVAPPLAFGALNYGKRIRKISRDLQESVGVLTKVSEEQLGIVKTIQSFNGEVKEVSKYNNQVRNVFNIGKKEAITSGVFFGSTGLIGNMTILSLLIYGTNLVSSNILTIGDLTSFMMYAAYTGSATFGLSNFYSELMKGAGAASRIFELTDKVPKIKTTKGLKLKNAKGLISFNHINFHYPTRTNVTIFNDLNFQIPQGSNVCLVGPSGGGKSTIISLLLRFYDPVSGSIEIDGENINKFSVKSLRDKIGVVQQEPVLLNGSIYENVSYGIKNATRQKVEEACKLANCKFLDSFPLGLDTQVGPRGTQLSGGQKQRIAIARTLIKNPHVLILDEATSALDSESENLINDTLNYLIEKGSITIISIAHRLSTIQRSNLIIVLNNNGSVAEIGKFNELYSNKNSHLWNLLFNKDNSEKKVSKDNDYNHEQLENEKEKEKNDLKQSIDIPPIPKPINPEISA